MTVVAARGESQTLDDGTLYVQAAGGATTARFGEGVPRGMGLGAATPARVRLDGATTVGWTGRTMNVGSSERFMRRHPPCRSTAVEHTSIDVTGERHFQNQDRVVAIAYCPTRSGNTVMPRMHG